MKTKSITKKVFFQMFFSMFLISIILAIIVFTFYEMNLSKELRENLINEESLTLKTLARVIGDDLGNVVSDLEFMRYELEAESYEHMGKEWSNFLISRKFYDQIRYIDSGGDEIVRVNYNDGNTVIVDKAGLQNKRDRGYFKHSIELGDSEIYISRFDLNVENGVIESPEKPMLRIGLRVKSDKLDGVIIINYLAEHLLNDIELFNKRDSGLFYLLNSDKDYLYHEDMDKRFRFMYDNHLDGNFDFDFPNVFNELSRSDDYIILDRNLFVLEDVFINNMIGNQNFNIVSDESLTIINHIDGRFDDYYYIDVKYVELIKLVIVKNRYSFLIVFIATFVISYLQYRIKKSKHILKELFEKDGLTDIYNRRAGMHYLNQMLKEAESEAIELSVTFIDVDGLKQVNDVLGHNMGDDLLLSVTIMVNNEIRDTDLFIRLGGDEFLLVLADNTIETTEHIMLRIYDKIATKNTKPEKPYKMSFSFGITSTFKVGYDSERLIKEADALMYQQKKSKDRSNMIKES